MARVFVLGATGGIGSRLPAHLAARGDDPLSLHRAILELTCGDTPVAQAVADAA
ncbi:hypothetical protein [Streptomyces sp. NPDC096311]|uniref:hypothetical protein n=1 Tax=Streptomyces sp. NPDC096311 TaxID=3366083 RepID=UPI003808E52C